MARPRNSDNTRQHLLILGMYLFAENGYSGTGLKQILDAGGVPKGSFYNYFASKEEYAIEVITHYMEYVIVQAKWVAEKPELSPKERIRAIHAMIIDGLESEGCKNGCLLGSLAAEAGVGGQVYREAMQRAYTDWIACYTGFVEDAQKAGEVRNDVPARDLAELFWNMWQGGLLKMRFMESTDALLCELNITLDTLFSPQKSN